MKLEIIDMDAIIEEIDTNLYNHYGTVTLIHTIDGYFLALEDDDHTWNGIHIGLDAYSELRKVVTNG